MRGNTHHWKGATGLNRAVGRLRVEASPEQRLESILCLDQRKQQVQRPSCGQHAWHVPEDEKLFSQRTAGILLTPAVPPRGLQCPLSSIVLTRCLVTKREVIDVVCTGHTPLMEPLKRLPTSFGAFFSGHRLI